MFNLKHFDMPENATGNLKFHIVETVYIVHTCRSDQMSEVKKILSLLIMVYKNHKIRYYALSNVCLPVTTSLEINGGLGIISLM